MPATVKPYLKPATRKDKTHAVCIRLTYARQYKLYTTGIYVLESQWNPKATYEKENWIKGHIDSGLFNRTIKIRLKEFIALAQENPFEDAEGLLRLYHKPAPVAVDFLHFFQKELERIKLTGNPRTYVRRMPLFNKLSEFASGSLPIEQLTVGFIRNFITWLQTEQKQGDKVIRKANAGETIKKEMQVLSGLCKIAVQEGILDFQKNPMPHIQVKSKPKQKDRLTPEQLKTFAEIELPARLHHVRNCFMLQYYLHGARITDVLELKHEGITEDRVSYVMRKTGTIKSIKRTPALNALLDQYPPKPGTPFVLPFMKGKDTALPLNLYLKRIESQTAFINRLLKEITKILEWDINVTSHVARHTLADIARTKVGMHLLQGMLAHKTMKTTERYVSSLDQNEMDEADAQVYG